MYELPKLNYGYDALEPFIDAKTMEIHYGKHHQAYVNKLNEVLAKYPDLENQKVEALLTNLNELDMEDKDKMALRNFGGGAINHSLFWEIMGPEKTIHKELEKELIEHYGSMEEFKKAFTQAAMSHFGSGWTWLVRDENGKLKIYSLPNQDSPYSLGHTPIFCLDLWEHAYYLKYQNRKQEFFDNFWNVLKIL